MLSCITHGGWTGVQVCLTMTPVTVTVQESPSQGAFLEGSTAHILVKGPWTWHQPFPPIPGASVSFVHCRQRVLRRVRPSWPNPSVPSDRGKEQGGIRKPQDRIKPTLCPGSTHTSTQGITPNSREWCESKTTGAVDDLHNQTESLKGGGGSHPHSLCHGQFCLCQLKDTAVCSPEEA